MFWLVVFLGLASLAVFSAQSAGTAAPMVEANTGSASAAPKLHVPDLAYYQGLYQNIRVDPRWFASHFTMTQQGGDDSYAVKFLRAGGLYAMQYTDPGLVSNCTWPAPYVCKGLGADLRDERDWLHAPDGTRLRVVSGGEKAQGKWQEKVNPGSSAVQAAYRAQTARFRGNAIFADDTSGDVDPTPPGKNDYDRYKFGAPPSEYCDERDCKRGQGQYARDTITLLESSAHPVFVNSGPSEVTVDMMRHSSKIIGAVLEGCSRRDEDEQSWMSERKFIERVNAMHRYAICLTYPTANLAADRAFALASFWVVQDGTYATVWEQFPRTGGDVGLMPEFGVVPTEPLDGGRSVQERAAGDGLYAREYARCSQDGRWFGRCAAVVNVSALPALFPKLREHYGQAMDFGDGGSWYDGATARWSEGVPRLIGPHSGVILR